MDITSLDLTKEFPRSPRDISIAGYVIAARCVDKCRAVVAGTNGEYHADCPLDSYWLDFTGIKFSALKKFLATGADDAAVSEWVEKKAKQKSSGAVIKWNNRMRDTQISSMPMKLQKFLETYVLENLPENKPPYVWFDVYDIEEKRI